MKNIFKTILVLTSCMLLFTACEDDDYFIGGDLHNPQVNMTTYDFLKSNNRGLFDTLLMIVDAAGMKEAINQPGITFFAPTDYSIQSYVNARTRIEQNIDPSRMWTVDSIIKYELPRFRDSLEIYIVPQKIAYEDLSQKGKLYTTAKGDSAVISYEPTDNTNLGYNSNSSFYPRIMYYNYLFGTLPDPFVAAEIPSSVGTRTRVQTSGVQTTTGVVNVLENGHRLFFFK